MNAKFKMGLVATDAALGGGKCERRRNDMTFASFTFPYSYDLSLAVLCFDFPICVIIGKQTDTDLNVGVLGIKYWLLSQEDKSAGHHLFALRPISFG